VLTGRCGADRKVWCLQEGVVLTGRYGADREVWC